MNPSHHRGPSISAIQCCCLVLLPWHSNCYLELVFRLAESPLYDLLTSWLAEEVLYDLQSHHILTCCVTTACLTACCGVTPQLSESMLGDMQGCSQLRCRLLSHGFAVCKILWPCDTSTFLAVYRAAGSLWKSSVSPQHKFKTLSRSVRSIFQLMPRCKGQKVQSQESVFYQGQWTVFFLTWHLLFITFFASWLLPSLLGFISSCSCAVCFCEFSIRLLKSNIALEFGTFKVSSGFGTKATPMMTTMRCCLAIRELKRKVLAKSPNLCRSGTLQVLLWAGRLDQDWVSPTAGTHPAKFSYAT